MAKGKRSSGKHYQSKGQHSNISRWLKNANRRDRRENPTPEQNFQSSEHRRRVIASPQNAKERELKEKYLAEAMIENQCRELLKKYGAAGLTRAGAIQAIKTDYVSTLTEKWNNRLAASSNKENTQ